MFSVLILTLNEERNLPAVLASLGPGLDVVVLDSGSTDATVALARAGGARVGYRRFDDFARQRNYAQTEIPFRFPWVLHLDADERLTPELAAECRALAQQNPPDRDGFFIAPKMLWQGHWLPRCTDFPAYQARFVRAPEFRFIEVGHGQREAPQMRMGYMQANYLHEMGADGTEAWLEKHRRYARREALQHQQAPAPTLEFRRLFATDRLVRRRALKQLSYVLPGRPFLRLVYQYILRGGFLDGGPAWHYCRLLARYEGFAVAELRRLRRSAPPASS